MAGSDSGPGEWLAHSSFLEGLVLPAGLQRPCNHNHARGCLEAVLKLEWSSNRRGRASGTGHSKQLGKGHLSVLASSAC